MGGFRSGGFHGGLGGFRGGYAAMHRGAFAGPGWHGGWRGRRFVGGSGYGGWGYGPYYDGYDGGFGLLGLGIGVATGDGYCSPYEYDRSSYCGSSYTIGRYMVARLALGLFCAERVHCRRSILKYLLG